MSKQYQEDAVTEVDLRLLRTGDRAAFSALVKTHHHALLAIATPLVGSNDAEEVVQNGWIKAYQSISRFEGRSHIKTWLTRIIMNEARMALRKTNRERRVTDQSVDSDDDPLFDRFKADGHWGKPPIRWDLDSPEELLMIQDLADCLDTLLANMPDNQRAVLEMRDTAEMPFEEICNELSLSASNVRVTLHRARSQLFKLVDHYQETGEC
jgi:RNA polymerase sigma-70 factor, ECF subfamily